MNKGAGVTIIFSYYYDSMRFGFVLFIFCSVRLEYRIFGIYLLRSITATILLQYTIIHTLKKIISSTEYIFKLCVSHTNTKHVRKSKPQT